MEMIENFPQHPWGLEKVPSPSGSEDSGLGWSPDALTAEYAFQLENSAKNNPFNYTDSNFSPQSQIDYKACYTDVESSRSEANSPEFSSFNQEQKPAADVIEFLEIFDQKPDVNTTAKQPSKKTYAKSNTKKRNSSTENSQSSKLQRCFQPKTGNGKPRQTSVKRKPSQKNTTACPYPGVRVETVREKLKKMRKGRGEPAPTTVSSTMQSLNALANNYTSQGYSQPSPNSMSPQYQQTFSPFQPQPHDVYTSSPAQTSPFTPASMTSPIHQNPPNYTSGSLASPNLHYELQNGEVDCLGEAYAPSLRASSPSRSSVCSVPQQISPSPEMSPGMATPTNPSPVSQYNDAGSPVNYGVVNSASSTCGYPNEQIFNYPSVTYARKPFPMQGSPVVPCEMPFTLSGSPQFSNPNQINFVPGLRDVVQSVRQGDIQQLRSLLACNRDCVDMQDESGKTLIFHAIENSQVEIVKLLLQFRANLNLINIEGNTVLHVAAACPKSDILVHLLKELLPEERKILLCKTSIKKGYTPLHVAAEAQLINNFMQLLQCGANYLIQDRVGFSPLHIVVRTANVMALRALLQVVKSAPNTLLSEKNLISLTNQRTKTYDTPLHYAAELHLSGEGQRHQYEILKLLLTHGADPTAMNRDGKSPKHLLPPSSTLLQMFGMHQLQSTVRCGYPSPEVQQKPMGCVPANQYNGGVYPHFQ